MSDSREAMRAFDPDQFMREWGAWAKWSDASAMVEEAYNRGLRAALDAREAATGKRYPHNWQNWVNHPNGTANPWCPECCMDPLAASPAAAPVEAREAVATLSVAQNEREGGVCYDVWLSQGMWSITTPGSYPLYASPAAATQGDAPNPLGFVKPDTDRQVFFYEQDFYVLSNFSAFNLKLEGQTFPTSEHAYHWFKFWQNGYGKGWPVALEIIAAPSAHEAFKIAERNKDRRDPRWDEVKVGIMRRILRAKAAQHEYVRRKLLATGDRELIEDSWRDDFWGWGPNRDGQNMLGKLWMQVRTELRAAIGAESEQATEDGRHG